jgi:hypothetical protein
MLDLGVERLFIVRRDQDSIHPPLSVCLRDLRILRVLRARKISSVCAQRETEVQFKSDGQRESYPGAESPLG